MLSKQVKQRCRTNRAIRRMSCNKKFRLAVKRHKRNGAIFVYDGTGLQIFSKVVPAADVTVLED